MSFRMAYAIQCHKNYKQINMLIDKLDDINVDFFIHVDAKSNISEKILKKNNVFILNDRVNVIWGNFSQVKATLNLFKEINSHKEYNYIHLISGQDFPIKNNEIIKQFFINNNGKEFIECRALPNDWAYGGMNRIIVYYPDFLFKNKFTRKFMWHYEKVIMKSPFLKKKIKIKIDKFYGGSSWFSLTGKCVEYILKYIENNPKYIELFEKSLSADEIFFQTIFMNSPFKENWQNDNKRYIKWKHGECSPKTLDLEDYESLISSDKLFARKFDSNINNEVLSRFFKGL